LGGGFLGAWFLGAGFLGAGFLGAGFLGAGFLGAGFLAGDFFAMVVSNRIILGFGWGMREGLVTPPRNIPQAKSASRFRKKHVSEPPSTKGPT